MNTIAERIAEQLGNDGAEWQTADGVSFIDLIEKYTPWHERDDVRELTRYVFADDSAIVAGVGAWDVEGKKPFSWQGAE